MNVLEKIASVSEVKHITFGTKVFAQIEKSKKVVKVSSFHKQGFFGNGVGVAVIDTGCASHFDLSFPTSNIKHFKNLISSTQTNFGVKWLVFICFFKIMFFSLESIMFIY